MKNRKFNIILCLILFSTAFLQANDKINVLIISGSNNHEWEKTTPALQAILEGIGLFSVEITERPDTFSTNALKFFNVILSNWNSWPEKDCPWSEATKSALLDFVKNGKGIVFVHAAGAANYNWPEYQKLAGGTWGEKTKHGKIAPFQVKLSNQNHPVTKGLSNFWITDELWVDMQNFNTTNVLGEAFAPISNSGSGEMEPVIYERKYGKGRSFYLVLGHNEQVMKNLGFQTLLTRGTEWAATGNITQIIPKELTIEIENETQKLRWKEEKNSLSILNNEKIVWQYNFSKDEGKPYFHPLCTPDGTELTWLRPDDHPWHRAVWFSWKYINGINYWEEDRETGKSKGITDILTSEYKLTDNHEAEINLKLAYHLPEGEDILSEERRIKVSTPAKDGSYYIDWETTFTAIEDVELNRTPILGQEHGTPWGGYAGFSARLGKNLWDVKTINAEGKTEELHGTESKWLTYDMKNLKGEPVSITIFDHPQNVNYPNKWFISKTLDHPFYYFSPAILFVSKHILKKGERLHLKYRLLVSPGKLNQNLLLDNWNDFKN